MARYLPLSLVSLLAALWFGACSAPVSEELLEAPLGRVDAINPVEQGTPRGGDVPSAEVESDEVEGVRILSLGDSYTIGSGGVDELERWPMQLAARLTESLAPEDVEGAGFEIAYPHLVARLGWTTSELMTAMDIEALAPGPEHSHQGEPFSLVTLLIGVNNQFRGQPIDEYQADLQVLLVRAVALAGGRPSRVIMLSIPDYGVTPFAAHSDGAQISQELDAFNAVGALAAHAAGVHWVDIVDISRRAQSEPSLLAPDGLHPSGLMYGLWADRAAPVAREALVAD